MTFLTKRKFLFLSMVVLMLAIGLRVSLSYFSLKHLALSTDEAISVMMAEDIANGDNYPLLSTGQPYQFPLEAYLMSPFMTVFSDHHQAARLLSFGFGALTTLIFLLTALKLFPERQRWPAVVLILLPSAYWLTYQSGYFIIQYPVSSVLVALIAYLGVSLNRNTRPALLLTLLLGFLSGLALSNHLLVISVVVSAALIAIFNGQFSNGLRRMGVLSAGLIIGLVPLLWVIATLPGAYEGVSIRAEWHQIPERGLAMLQYAVPGVMGVNPPHFGDYPRRIDWGEWPRLVFVAGFVVVLGTIFLSRLSLFFVNSFRSRWLSLRPWDMYLGISLIALFLIASNAKATVSDHRYLLPLAWSFPFLIGYLYTWKHQLVKMAIAGLVVVLALFNSLTSAYMVHIWSDAYRIQRSADIPDLSPLHNWLADKGYTSCYTTFWLSYRVVFESDRKTLCAPIYNERFLDWPVPYKQDVDQHDNVPYVISDNFASKFGSDKFKKEMHHAKISYKTEVVGAYYVFHEFEQADAAGEIELSADKIAIDPVLTTVPGALTDGNKRIVGLADVQQTTGQSIELRFTEPQNTRRVSLFYPFQSSQQPVIQLSGLIDGNWQALTDPLAFKPQRLQFEHGHPVFGDNGQAIRFSARVLEAIKVDIVEPGAAMPWQLTEIHVGIVEG